MQIPKGRTRCPMHESKRERAYERARTQQRAAKDPLRSIYRSRSWRHTSELVMRRDGFRCRAVEHGQRCLVRHPAKLYAHHHPHTARELYEHGLDICNPDRCVTVCSHHHRVATQQEQRARADNAGTPGGVKNWAA
jgi:hypothetical protein